jgi:hypothetical protein
MPKPKPTHRISRVAELIQREIGHLLITEKSDTFTCQNVTGFTSCKNFFYRTR